MDCELSEWQRPNFKFDNIFSECFLDVFRCFPVMSEQRRDILDALEPAEVISEEKISFDSDHFKRMLSKQTFAWELNMSGF